MKEINEKLELAYISEDILRKADSVNLGYNILEKYNVSEDVIYSLKISLKERDLLNVFIDQSNNIFSTDVTAKGRSCYKLSLLSNQVKTDIETEKVDEKRAKRGSH